MSSAPRNLVVVVNTSVYDQPDESQRGAAPTEHSDWANFPALGALQIASVTNLITGVESVYFDATVCPVAVIGEFLESHKKRVLALAVSALTATYQQCIDLFRLVKELDPRIFTIIGNDHFTALGRQCLMNQNRIIDYGIKGDNIFTALGGLIAAMRDGLQPPDNLPGLTYLKSNFLVSAATRLEFPNTIVDYGLIDAAYPHSRYYNAHFRHRTSKGTSRKLTALVTRGVPVEIARGCVKFARDDACSFCSIQFDRFWKSQVPNATKAWSVIEGAVRAGYDYLYVTADELPLTFPQLLHSMRAEIPPWWRALEKEDQRPILVGYARADGLARSGAAELLADLGFKIIMVGIDAGNARGLLSVNKPLFSSNRKAAAKILFERNRDAFAAARSAGLLIKVGVVIGGLGLDHNDILDSVQGFRELIGDYSDVIASVDAEILSPEPGSRDFRCLLDPALGSALMQDMSASVPTKLLSRMAEKWRMRDVISYNEVVTDWISLYMPAVSIDDLRAARSTIRNSAQELGIFVGGQA